MEIRSAKKGEKTEVSVANVGVSEWCCMYPWLSRMVADAPDLEACFLPQLSSDGVFKGFAGFDEACHRRVEPARPFSLLFG